MPQPVIGFIGLGLMGVGFTRRLTAQGYGVVGCDVVAEKAAAAMAWGVTRCASPARIAEAADIVLIAVTTPADLVSIVEGPDGILSAVMPRAAIIVDHSTTDIATTRRLADMLQKQAGMGFIDAPVSGGPAAAESGTLAIMAGGHDSAIAAVRPVMERLGRFTHMGAIGAGQATKLVNQALVLTNYCVIAEALRLAEAYGIDAAKVPEALATGHAGSNLLPVLFPRMLERDFAARGFARQVLKDLELLNDAAHEKRLALPMAGQALTLYRLLNAAGKGELDGSAILTLWPDPATG
ncbi:MAG: NAD(P)-dependent oxidoreductase [Hyphomicrobiaceae bacterium]